MELQTAFYVIGIIFMSLMLLIMIALAVAVLVIKKKIDHIHQTIEDKLAIFSRAAQAGSSMVNAAKKIVKR